MLSEQPGAWQHSQTIRASAGYVGEGPVEVLHVAHQRIEAAPLSEQVHQLIRSLEAGGESVTAALLAKLGNQAEVARELAYRLYALCERKKRAAEALSYNGLVQSWPEISRLAREDAKPEPAQAQLI